MELFKLNYFSFFRNLSNFLYIVLRNMERIEKLLGNGGINIIRKVFGVILLAIAVKLFKTNVANI